MKLINKACAGVAVNRLIQTKFDFMSNKNALSVTEKKGPDSTTNLTLYFASITVLLSYYDSIVDDWMFTGQQVHFTAGFQLNLSKFINYSIKPKKNNNKNDVDDNKSIRLIGNATNASGFTDDWESNTVIHLNPKSKM